MGGNCSDNHIRDRAVLSFVRGPGQHFLVLALATVLLAL